MTDQRAVTDDGRHSRVAKGEELEIQHLMETTRISADQAKSLLRRFGTDWHKIRQEAAMLKDES